MSEKQPAGEPSPSEIAWKGAEELAMCIAASIAAERYPGALELAKLLERHVVVPSMVGAMEWVLDHGGGATWTQIKAEIERLKAKP